MISCLDIIDFHGYFILMIISTAAVILNKNKILLAKRKPGGTLGDKWEFPGGKTKPQENPEDGLKREISEELGITVVIKEYIGEINFFNKNKEYKLLAYHCLYTGDKISILEHAEVSWMTVDKISSLDLADSDKSILPIVTNYLKKIL